MPAMRVAAIDCGTNSIRLLVTEGDQQQEPVELDRRLELVRLGQGVDASGEFHPDALRRTFEACDQFAQVIREFGCERVRFVATSAARDVRNQDEFFDGVRHHLGVQAEVIGGDEEARLSFAGAVSGVIVDAEPILVIDIGGGSTELVIGESSGSIRDSVSLNMGSVRLSERFLHDDPPTGPQISAAVDRIDALLDGWGVPLTDVKSFIGVAGTITSLSAVHQGLTSYDRDRVHGSRLSLAELSDVTDWLLGTTAQQIIEQTCLPARRAEVISAGALIARQIARRVQCQLVVSESDILDGIARQLLAER